MMYFGFDLGDGESCIHWTKDGSTGIVNVAPVSGHGSFLSAVARLEGNTVVGHTVKENQEKAEDVHVCFKRDFLKNDPETDRVIRDFVRGVLAELRKNAEVGAYVDDEENACFIVGCPAGWQAEDRERYRQLMLDAGMKNVKIVSESRAAFENALHSAENGIDPGMGNQTVLIIDIGSSTLDFAYVQDGNEYDVATMGNVQLGGGMMDEMIVLHSLDMQAQETPALAQEVQALIAANNAKKSKLMLAVRDMKEDYFKHEDLFLEENRVLEKTVKLFGNGKIYKVRLTLSPEIVENYLISQPHPLLSGQSFESRLRDSLVSVYEQTRQRKKPDLVILTGGPSRMQFFQDLCRVQFASSRVIVSDSPEYDISRGLVFVGSVDENMTQCLREIEAYVHSSEIEEKIEYAVPELVRSISRPLTESILHSCVKPAFFAWRNGKLDTLSDFQEDARRRIEMFMQSSDMQNAIEAQAEPWSEKIISAVEMDLCEISRKYHVDFKMDCGQLRIHGGSGKSAPITINFIHVIHAVVSIVLMVVMATLCGGSGIALLSIGLAGMIAGVVLSLVVAVLGKEAATNYMMDMKIPVFLRGVIRERSILSEKNAQKIDRSICHGMLADTQMTGDLVSQVSDCIDAAILSTACGVEQNMVS